jgi:hypothetical protein
MCGKKGGPISKNFPLSLSPSASIGKKMAYQLPYGAAVAYIAIPGAAGGAAMGIPIAAVPSFTPANPAAYAAFQSVDTDRSGSIDWKELRTSLGSSFGDANFPGEPGRWRVGRARALGEDIPPIALSLSSSTSSRTQRFPRAPPLRRLRRPAPRATLRRRPLRCVACPFFVSSAACTKKMARGAFGSIPHPFSAHSRPSDLSRPPSLSYAPPLIPSLPPISPSPQAPSSTPSSRPCTGS